MGSVRFEPHGVEVELTLRDDLLSVAQRAGVPLTATCGGTGRCGRCLVQVVEGEPGRFTENELLHLTPEEQETGWRLACQYIPEHPLVLQLPRIRFDGAFKSSLGLADHLEGLQINPAVVRVRVALDPPTLEDNASDADRVLMELALAGYEPCQFRLEALQQLPDAVRKGDWRVDIWLRQNTIIGCYPADEQPFSPFGLAYDIGTTTVAAYLVALTTGELIAVTSTGNTQSDFGGDVMSRIAAAKQGHHADLQQRVVSVMNGLAARLVAEAGIETGQVADIVAVGNTCMTHLLLGVSPTHLGVAPYVPAFTTSQTITARDIGLNVHPAAALTVLPNIGGFVGADTVGAIIASGIDRSEQTWLLLDIGTNAEVVLGSKAGLVACSTAAGPAFEGACMTHGMRAGPGAIDHVAMENGELTIHTISDENVRGIAGSGLVSIAATLLRTGLLSHQGLFKRQAMTQYDWYIQEAQGVIELATPEHSATRQSIYLKEEDIAQLQLARAAIMAGIEVLLEHSHLTTHQIDHVLLAGAFGNYMDRHDAAVIGLYPPQLVAHTKGIGNAAGAGAIRALVNVDERERADRVASSTRYVELSALPDFNHRFVMHIPFPETRLGGNHD